MQESETESIVSSLVAPLVIQQPSQTVLPGIHKPSLNLVTKHKLTFAPLNFYGTFVKRLGQGTFGTVFMIRREQKITKTSLITANKEQEFAVKEFRANYDDDANGLGSDVMREIAVLLKLDHPNIVKLIDVAYFKISGLARPIDMVLELAGTSLAHYIKTPNNKDRTALFKSYMYQLCRGLDYIHDCGIWHRDIKPANILLFQDGRIVFADFGIARFGTVPGESYTTLVQTLFWRAPELLLGAESYGPQIDVFSLGVVFADMWKGEFIFSFDTKHEVILKQISVLGHMVEEDWPGISGFKEYNNGYAEFAKSRRQGKWEREFPNTMDPRVIDIIKRMTYPNPSRRAHIKEILRDSYFDDVRPFVDKTLPAAILSNHREELNNDTFLCISSPYPNINYRMYVTVYDWMLHVSNSFRLKPETFFHARILIDCFLAKRKYVNDLDVLYVKTNTLQLIGCACLFISAKVLEKEAVEHRSFVDVADNSFTANQLFKAELSVLRVVEFDLVYPTVPEYLYYLDLENKNLTIKLAQVYTLSSDSISSKWLAEISAYIVNGCYGKPGNDIYIPLARKFIENIRATYLNYEPNYLAKILGSNRELNLIINNWPNCNFSGETSETPLSSKSIEQKVENNDYYQIRGSLEYTHSETKNPLDRDQFSEFVKQLILDKAANGFLVKHLRLQEKFSEKLIQDFAKYLTLEKGVNNKYMIPKVLPNRMSVHIGAFKDNNTVDVTIRFLHFPVELREIFNEFIEWLEIDDIFNNGIIEGSLEIIRQFK